MQDAHSPDRAASEREPAAQQAERLREELQGLEAALAPLGTLPAAAVGSLACVKARAESLSEALWLEEPHRELRVSEAQFRAAFESSSIGMAQADPATGKLLRVNRRYCEMTGYDESELVGRDFLELTYAPDLVHGGGLPELLQGTTREYRVEKRLVRKDGSLIWVIVVANLVRDDEGRPRVTLALVQDITERKNAEEALRRSEERYRLATDAMNGLVYDVDLAANTVRRSKGMFQLLGLRRDEVPLTSEWWLERLHPDDLAVFLREREEAFGTRSPSMQREYRVRHRDGRWIWVRDHAHIVYGPGHEGPSRLIGCIVSIDEQHRFQEALLAADDRKNQFLATLAHELRNPLAPVRNAVGILRLTGLPRPEAQTAVDMIERQIAHLSLLVDDLLDVSRITHGKIELKRQRVDLRVLVEDALGVSEALLEAAAHTVAVRQPPMPVFVEADRVRLVQVVCNLLNNAGRYTPRGGRIAVEVATEGGHALVRVEDNGVGMPPEMLEHIFEPFTQLGARPASQGGLGIGLWLVRTLVQMHGGSVFAHSDGLGRGSSVGFRLPAAPPGAAAPAQDAPGALAPPLQRFLVVDDNRDVAESQATLLRLLGHEVATAYDGETALELARSLPPQVVLLDLGMPGLNGFEVAERLRRIPGLEDVLIIAQTGWGQEEDRRRSAQAGFDAHLTKPTSVEAVLALVAERRGRDEGG